MRDSDSGIERGSVGVQDSAVVHQVLAALMQALGICGADARRLLLTSAVTFGLSPAALCRQLGGHLNLQLTDGESD